MMYILAEALIFAIALTPLGYMVYRVHRIAMIERMGRQLSNEKGGYSPLVEPAPDAFPLRYRSPYGELSGPRLIPIPGTDKWAYGYQPSFHYGDKVTITSGVYSGMKAVIDGEISGSGYPVWIDANGTVRYNFIPKKHLRLVTTPPQSVSAIIPYHAIDGEQGPDDLPISPYADDEIYELMKEWAE